MRALEDISNLCRVLLGVVLACGLLLLPPSSVHAESGMHESEQAAHHAGHQMTAASELQQDVAALPDLTDIPESFEGEPCCGGICLTAALTASQDAKITAVRSVEYASVSHSVASGGFFGTVRLVGGFSVDRAHVR